MKRLATILAALLALAAFTAYSSPEPTPMECDTDSECQALYGGNGDPE